MGMFGGMGFGKKNSIKGMRGRGGKLVKAFCDDEDEDGTDGVSESRGARAEEGTSGDPTSSSSSSSYAFPTSGRGAASGEGLEDSRKEEIQKTAEWLHENPESEPMVISNGRDNPVFSFLFDPTTREGAYYLAVRAGLKLRSEGIALQAREQATHSAQRRSEFAYTV